MEYLSQDVSELAFVVPFPNTNMWPLGNKVGFEPMLESMQSLAENLSDPSSQRAAFTFLSRCVLVWGQLGPDQTTPAKGKEVIQSHGLPGFERFVYERLIPGVFGVLSSPQFNLRDPQMLSVSATHNTLGLQLGSWLLSLGCT